MFTIWLLIGTLLFLILAAITGLRIGVRWRKLPKPAYWRSVVAYLLSVGIGILGYRVVVETVTPDVNVRNFLILSSVITFLIHYALVLLMHGGSFSRAAVATFCWFGGQAVALGILWLVVKPYVFEAFVASSNSMAPTVRGPHMVEKGKDGKEIVFSINLDGRFARRGPFGIHETSFEVIVSRDEEFKGEVRSADRFICNKLKSLNRWDMVCFRPPFDQETVYVKRLVGLPGEKLQFRDNAVYINDVKLELPSNLAGVYSSKPLEPVWMPDGQLNELLRFGVGEPYQLRPDEYFFVGDNFQQSQDSRAFGGISKDKILGVADLIYWPLNRWKIFP